MKGKVQTVCAVLDKSQLGIVLPHEHLHLNVLAAFHKEPLVHPHLAHCEFSLKNLGWIRQFPYSHVPNMIVESPEPDSVILEDLKTFKAAGGSTIVENSTKGMKRNLDFMKKASEETGVNIVAGTAFYVEANSDKDTLNLNLEEMVEELKKDLTTGCSENPSIKCGMLGEVGSTWPITDYEKRALRAAGEVESCLGCPVMIHPGRNHKAPSETLRIYSEAGGNPSRAVMAHLDRTFDDVEELMEFASSFPCYLEYDLFGLEVSYYQQAENVIMISDAQRIQFVKDLIGEGYCDRILLSHDIHTKHRMGGYGGHGYAHLLHTVRPQMLSRGITQEEIDIMMIQNPANWLAFAK